MSSDLFFFEVLLSVSIISFTVVSFGDVYYDYYYYCDYYVLLLNYPVGRWFCYTCIKFIDDVFL